MTYAPLVYNHRQLSLSKAIVDPKIGAKTVLTNEPWDFVELELVRNTKDEARTYWQQAKEFYRVAQGLPLQSAPLLLYYSFMNAAKALLSSKGVKIDPMHGVSEWKPGTKKNTQAFTVGVKIKNNGVVPSLSKYYGETESQTNHLLKDILFNLPFVHRTYSLTYVSHPEIFFPIVNPLFIVDSATNNVFFQAQLSTHYLSRQYTNRLPLSVKLFTDTVRSVNNVQITSPKKLATNDLVNLASLAKSLRDDLFYINGVQTLWYLKATTNRNRIRRQTATLILAAMHRLSEVCRYAPMQLEKYLSGQKNWLLSEFIRMSGVQFIDEIASEITGKNVMIPNVRPAN